MIFNVFYKKMTKHMIIVFNKNKEIIKIKNNFPISIDLINYVYKQYITNNLSCCSQPEMEL